jgi:hypothetical protein
MSEWEKKQSEQRALANRRAQIEEQVRMAKEMVQATGTDYLESADGATSQN